MPRSFFKISGTIFLFYSFLIFIGCTDSGELKQLNNPNFIYILADDMGYGDIQSFNENGQIVTPNLDRLVAEGMKFTDAHTSSSVCTPTRYSIMTGRYNWRSKLKSGVLTGKSKALIPTDRLTVASMLQANGYHTSFIGKWHLGWNWAMHSDTSFGGEGWDHKDFDILDFSKPITHTPNDLGFDYAYGHSGSLDMAPYVYVENGRATAVPTDTTVNTGKFSWWRKGYTSPDFVHEDVTPNFFRRAIDLIDQRSKGQEPFFLYLALPSPHTPILPTEEWKGKSGLNPYGDFVVMIDDYVGQLMAALKESGIDENTMVIFTTDNGCSPQADFEELYSLGHDPSYIFRGHKADIFEGGHRVPFVVRWPNQIEGGTVSNQTICTTDFMATAAEIIGYSLSDHEAEDSYSLLPLLTGKNFKKEFREATVHHSINGSFAIRRGEWKLILCPGSGGWSTPRPNQKALIESLPKFQLYHLKEDPSETNNLVDKHPNLVKEMKDLLVQYIREGRSTPGVPQSNEPSENGWPQIGFTE